MVTKAGILEQIGERHLLLPELINRGLAANDRLEYYLTLLQAAHAYAQSPHSSIPDLRHEREASGIAETMFDDVVGASRMVTHEMVHVPGVASIMEHLFGDVQQMLAPIVTAATARPELAERATVYTRRLDAQLLNKSASTDDQLPRSLIDSLTRLSANGHDTVHQLVMDLHWELNRLQATVAVEVIDGAHAYGLTEDDRRLVRAFMRGVNDTAPLKFNHPGLDTTATRDGDHVSIQNDLGVTDVHVVVVHVTGLVASLVYTDAHRSRMQFVHELLKPYDVAWRTDPAGTRGFEMSTGAYTAEHQEGLEQFLTYVGSRLVFLIDWNRARKRLGRLVKKSDAVALLKWAADNNIGHAAFIQAGDIRLIHSALDRATPTQVQYGARLDEILGRDAAKRFLMAVLRIVSAGLSRRHSARLIDDEIEAELLTYLEGSDRSFLGAVADHAMVVAGMVEWIRREIVQLKSRQTATDGDRTARLIRAWKSDADAIAQRSRRAVGNVGQRVHLRRLLSAGDRAVAVLEEAIFILTLVPQGIEAGVADLLDQLTDVASRAVREYVRCLEDARDLSRRAARPELERFLVTVDRLSLLAENCDEAQRAIRTRMLRDPAGTFREVYTLTELTRRLDSATRSVVRSGLLVRDYVLSIAAGA